MKHLKTFEYINFGKPEVGDYVILKNKPEYSNQIGIITNKFSVFYIIKFENKLIKSFDFDIKYWSKNKKQLEEKLK